MNLETACERIEMLLLIWALGFPIFLLAGIAYVRIFKVRQVWSEDMYHPITGWDIIFPAAFWPLTAPVGAAILLISALISLVDKAIE